MDRLSFETGKIISLFVCTLYVQWFVYFLNYRRSTLHYITAAAVVVVVGVGPGARLPVVGVEHDSQWLCAFSEPPLRPAGCLVYHRDWD